MSREKRIAESIDEDINQIVARFLVAAFAVICIVVLLTAMKTFAIKLSQALILLLAGLPGGIFGMIVLRKKYTLDITKTKNALCFMMCLQMIAAAVTAFSYAGTIALLLPVILAALYPKSRNFHVVVAAMMVSGLVVPPLTLLLGFWDGEYYQFLFSLSYGMHDFSGRLIENRAPLGAQILYALRYMSTQSVLIVGGFSFIGNRLYIRSNKSFENQVEIARLSEADELTGLLNRNCYEKRMLEADHYNEPDMVCFYCDANGLHELNNREGHQAGDAMLQFIGKQLQDAFGEDNTYRVGGDEYVAFAKEIKPEKLPEIKASLEEIFASEGYHVAIGYAQRDSAMNQNELVLQAEKEMYRSKSEYYSKHDRRRAPR